MTIRPDVSELAAAEMCRGWWQEVIAWRQGIEKPISYTFSFLIDRYLSDALSPYHEKQPATQENYRYECVAIKSAIGKLRFDPIQENGTERPRIVGEDIRRWHRAWGNPAPYQIAKKDGTVRTVTPAPTPSRARHLIMMVRTLVSYGVEIGAPGCKDLRDRLSVMKFSVPPARTKAPTYDQVDAFVVKALELGFRSQAITTLAQYELIERRVHIIGQWQKEAWRPGWEWERVTPEWVIQYYQTKTEAKTGLVLREFDLKKTQRLLGLMQETPKENRKGPIILCEWTGKPWAKRAYQDTWRQIANAAGLPADVWSMDMRAGGVTEADEIGIPDRMLRDAAGHTEQKTTDGYRRQKQRNAQNVVELRQMARDRK